MADKSKEIKIVRIAGTDIHGTKKLIQGLIQIKGVSFMFANAVAQVLGLDKSKRFGDLTDEEINKINDVLENTEKYNIPSWLLNRRKDWETGVDKHLIGSDVPLAVKMDIKRLQEIKSRRGMRHALGLKVRGQRLKSNARRGKTVGVKRRKGAKKGR